MIIFLIDSRQNPSSKYISSRQYRYKSLFNSSEGPWRDNEEDAKSDGKKHKLIIDHYFNEKRLKL